MNNIQDLHEIFVCPTRRLELSVRVGVDNPEYGRELKKMNGCYVANVNSLVP